MPRQAAALEDSYVRGMYGAGRHRGDSRARSPSASDRRRPPSRSPPPGLHSPSSGRRQEDRPVVAAHASTALAHPTRHGDVHSIGDDHRHGDVRTLETFEDMGLTDLFQEHCPGWAIPTEFMTTVLNKLSQHHPGHLRVRTPQDILYIVKTSVYNGVHDLSTFSGWAPACLVQLLEQGGADWSVLACAKDLCSFVTKLRDWCNWVESFAGEEDADKESNARVLRDLESPKDRARSRGRRRRSPRSGERNCKMSHERCTPSPNRRRSPPEDTASRSPKRSKKKKEKSRSPKRSRSRRLLRIESALQRVSYKKFGEDFVPGDEDFELPDYLGKRADMSRAVDELLSERKLENFDVDFLPDPKTIVDLHRIFSRSNSPHISQKPLEDIIPVYVLQGLPTNQRTAILKSRQTDVPSMSRLLESIMSFWLTHHVVGMVSLRAIVHHLFIVLKMAQSKTVAHATWYSRLLPDHVRSRVVRKNTTVESFLETVIEEVDKKAGDMARKSLGLKDKSLDNGDPFKKKAVVKKSVQEGGPKGHTKHDPVPMNKQICLAHDAANNKICPKGADCPRVHLDTKKSPKDAKSYKEAQELVQRLKKRAKTGSG